jgi:hypothetical protein
MAYLWSHVKALFCLCLTRQILFDTCYMLFVTRYSRNRWLGLEQVISIISLDAPAGAKHICSPSAIIVLRHVIIISLALLASENRPEIFHSIGEQGVLLRYVLESAIRYERRWLALFLTHALLLLVDASPSHRGISILYNFEVAALLHFETCMSQFLTCSISSTTPTRLTVQQYTTLG